MSSLVQKIKTIHPHAGYNSPVRTFVNSQNISTNTSRNGYISYIFTIWAPREDIDNIYEHIQQSIADIFNSESTNSSLDSKYNKAISKINAIIGLLRKYYHKNDKRFKIDGIIALLSSGKLIISNCNNLHAYLSQGENTYALFDNTKITDSSYIFSEPSNIKLEANDFILLTSSRFDDRIPRTILFEHLNNTGGEFSDFAKKIISLHGQHLAIIAIEVSLKAPNNSHLTPDITKNRPATEIKNNDNKQLRRKRIVIYKLNAIVKKISTPINRLIIIPTTTYLKKTWNTLWSKYINAHPLLSLLIVISIFVVIISTIGYFIAYNPHNQSLQKQYNNWRQKISSAETQINTDNNAALKSLNVVKANIQAMQPKDQVAINKIVSSNKNPTLNDLIIKITTLEDKINRITRLSANTIYQNPKTSQYGPIALLGDMIYSIDITSGDIINIDTSNSNTKLIGGSAELKNSISLTANTNGNLYASTKDNVFQITSAGSVTKQTNTVNSWPSAVDLTAYTNAIYLLSPSDNQIYKYIKTNNNFGSPINYLKSPSPNLLVDSTATAINGSVFVLYRSGSIKSFNQGIQKEFVITDIPSDMKDTTKLVYVSDPEKLILLNAQKAFVELLLTDTGAQYKQEVIVNGTTAISSFVYNQNSKKVYFTSNNTIQSFTLTQ